MLICPACHAAGHQQDALFCRRCGCLLTNPENKWAFFYRSGNGFAVGGGWFHTLDDAGYFVPMIPPEYEDVHVGYTDPHERLQGNVVMEAWVSLGDVGKPDQWQRKVSVYFE